MLDKFFKKNANMKRVYAGPEQMGNRKKFEGVYAGPDMVNKEDAEILEVYAGPGMMDELDYEEENDRDYPGNYDDGEKVESADINEGSQSGDSAVITESEKVTRNSNEDIASDNSLLNDAYESIAYENIESENPFPDDANESRLVNMNMVYAGPGFIVNQDPSPFMLVYAGPEFPMGTKINQVDIPPEYEEPKLVIDEDGNWICPNCQTKNKDGFCSECGQKKPKGDDGIYNA
ncbi:MAG: zinc ribbon domain-containing protein [Lachnospiraceae bacterium]|nr:zinc ribbon domain-containing protein [Lachnospiraceae bacterium]